MDHRQGSRHRVLELVKIRCRRGYNPGIIYDISPDGMFIVSETVPDLNDSVDICMLPASEENTPVRIPGVVVHRRNNGFGMIFGGLDGAARRLVRKLLERAWKIDMPRIIKQSA